MSGVTLGFDLPIPFDHSTVPEVRTGPSLDQASPVDPFQRAIGRIFVVRGTRAAWTVGLTTLSSWF